MYPSMALLWHSFFPVIVVLSSEKTQSIFLSWFPGSDPPSHDVAKHSRDTQAERATDNHLCACLLTLFQ